MNELIHFLTLKIYSISVQNWENTFLKTIRKVEQRFPNYTEIDKAKGKRDRTKQEIFLHENYVSWINYFSKS